MNHNMHSPCTPTPWRRRFGDILFLFRRMMVFRINTGLGTKPMGQFCRWVGRTDRLVKKFEKPMTLILFYTKYLDLDQNNF